MENKHPEHKDYAKMRTRFETENEQALREAREEQRRLKAQRKKSGVPDKMFTADWPKGTTVIFCRRGVSKYDHR